MRRTPDNGGRIRKLLLAAFLFGMSFQVSGCGILAAAAGIAGAALNVATAVAPAAPAILDVVAASTGSQGVAQASDITRAALPIAAGAVGGGGFQGLPSTYRAAAPGGLSGSIPLN